jgi:TonB family protein
MRKTITWRIAEDLAPSNPLTIRTVVEIGPYGQGTSCLLELGGALKPPPGTPPAVCPVSRLRVDFSNDTRFGGAIDRIISEQIFWPGPSAPPQPVEPGPGQALVGRLVLRLEIDATGKLTSCKLLEHVGSQPFVDPCPAIPKQYAARKGADGKPRPFSATQIFSTLVEVDRNRQPPGNLRNMLQGLISSDDYPPEALDNGEEGTVGILLRIDPAGAVGDCIVEQASGSALLDNKTCEVMRQRAKFKPALDKQGRPTGGEYRTHIKWQIAEDRLPSDPWVSRMVISFGPNGRASSCRMELEGAMKPPAGTPALGCPPAALQVPAPGVDDQAGPTATLVTETRFEVGSASPPPLVPGGTVVISQVLSLAIDASGTLTSCKIVATSPAGSNPDACSSVGKYYEPRKGPDGTPAPFEATETIVSIARR